MNIYIKISVSLSVSMAKSTFCQILAHYFHDMNMNIRDCHQDNDTVMHEVKLLNGNYKQIEKEMLTKEVLRDENERLEMASMVRSEVAKNAIREADWRDDYQRCMLSYPSPFLIIMFTMDFSISK